MNCPICDKGILDLTKANIKSVDVFQFSAKIKSSKISRISDFTVTFSSDLDNLQNIYFVCPDCKSEIQFKDLNLENTCIICNSNASIGFCETNEIYICEEHREKYLKYCNICPIHSTCELLK